MKTNVIVDQMGNLLGAFQVGSFKDTKGEEMEAGITPLDGQFIYEIDVSDDIKKRPVQEIHQEIFASLSSKLPGQPKLKYEKSKS
jgi:hypothetical protein